MELDDDDDNYVIRDSDARPIRSRAILRLSSSIFSCTSGTFSSVVAALRSLHLLSEGRNLAVVRVDPLGDNQLLAFRRGDVRPDGDLRLHLLPSHDLVTQLDLQLFPISSLSFSLFSSMSFVPRRQLLYMQPSGHQALRVVERWRWRWSW